MKPSVTSFLRFGSAVRTGLFLLCVSLAAGSVVTPAVAEALDGPATEALALEGTWDAEGEWGFWSWAGDGTVCVRIFGPEGDCADTGTWKVEDDVLCYELTWFGEGYDVRKNCFTVNALGEGRHETRYHGTALDSVFFTFSVLE